MPPQVLYSQLVEGKHAPGGQKSFKDNIRENLKKCHIGIKTREATATHKAAWRLLVQDGAAQYDDHLHSAAEDKRRCRKEIASTKKVPPKPTKNPLPTLAHIAPKYAGPRPIRTRKENQHTPPPPEDP